MSWTCRLETPCLYPPQAAARWWRRWSGGSTGAEVDLQPVNMFDIEVTYSADQIEVNDRITVTSVVRFTPPVPAEAGMVVLDVSVPTGFAPAVEGIEKLVSGNARIKRFDLAGRKGDPVHRRPGSGGVAADTV